MIIDKEVKIICGDCGHVETSFVKSEDIYFPNRKLYRDEGIIKCSKCDNWSDMIIFGTQTIFNMHNMNINILPEVLENNRIYETVQFEAKAKVAVNLALNAIPLSNRYVKVPRFIQVHIDALKSLKSHWGDNEEYIANLLKKYE